MRQVARRLQDAELELIEVPDPGPGPSSVAVRVEASVLSSGTERASLEVADKNLLAKARARPEQAKAVIEKARAEGVRSTVDLVRKRLKELAPIGYSAAGTVVEVGAEVRGLAPGDSVAIAGAGNANHAELDIVPQLLCARIPAGVDPAQAAFGTLGAIAMQGFRRGEATVGATVAVVGLGLIGQLSVRIARAAGCRVIGLDLDPALLELARVDEGVEAVLRDDLGESLHHRADAVLITAAAPQSDDPVRVAAELARDRAPVVVVGDVKLDIPRGPYYYGELDLRLSRSYGPGRYDPAYELHGHDYPIGYVRWTEQRNIESFLALLAEGKLTVAELITHRFGFDDALEAFALLTDPPAGERPIGIVLDYPGAAVPAPTRPAAAARATAPAARDGAPRLGLIGSGSFATSKIVPGLVGAGLEPVAVASARGLSAEDARRRFEFEASHADALELIARGDLDLVAIASRHDSHAALAAAALEAGIPTYVEKPLSLDEEGLAAVVAAQAGTGAPLWVGFNRRHAPLTGEIREALGAGPRLMRYRVNAGRLEPGHWTNDPAVGGGRLLGEGCHFIDYLIGFADSDPVRVLASGFPSDPGLARQATDNFSVRIEFADGSVGTLDYAADADPGPGKERFEASTATAYAVLDDYRAGEIWRGRERTKIGGRRQDKGFDRQYEGIAAVLKGEAEAPSPAAFLLSTHATLAAARSLRTGAPEPIVEAG